MCLCVARACRHHLSRVHPYRVGVQSEPECCSSFYIHTSEVRCLFRVRRTPTPSASNWPRYLPRKLVGGGGAASPSERRKQCMQLCAQTELVAQADACAVLRTWFSRRGRPRGETSREHSRQGQGVPRDHTAFSACSLLPPRCPVHPTHGVS